MGRGVQCGKGTSWETLFWQDAMQAFADLKVLTHEKSLDNLPDRSLGGGGCRIGYIFQIKL